MATVNNIITIKKEVPPTYYHCFKISDSKYAIFDAKLDMPLFIGSLNITKSIKLPDNSFVFYYEMDSTFVYKKGPEKYIKIEGNGRHTKPPLRYNIMDEKRIIYHHFKITPVLFTIFDDRFDMPLAYGSNQKVAAVVNKIPKGDTVFYYKEDPSIKHSFKLYMTYQGKSSKS